MNKTKRPPDPAQRALAAEIAVGTMASRQPKVTASAGKEESVRVGTYFVQCTNDVPMSVVYGVAEILGVPAEDLMRRAAVAAALEPTSPRARRRMERDEAAGRAIVEAEHPEPRPSRGKRAPRRDAG